MFPATRFPHSSRLAGELAGATAEVEGAAGLLLVAGRPFRWLRSFAPPALRSLLAGAGVRALLAGVLAAVALGGCSVVGRVTELPKGWYTAPQLSGADSLTHALHGRRVYAELVADTLQLTATDGRGGALPTARYVLQPDRPAVLLDRQLDVDVFTLPFKIRPARANVPVQFNSNFNAALYVGRRFNFYHLSAERRNRLPGRPLTHITATGLGYGAFGGVGSTTITPDLTRGHAALDYEGLVLNAGLAAIYDARVFNLGAAVGLDFLAGPDRAHWIYHRRPWFGILFGLNLN